MNPAHLGNTGLGAVSSPIQPVQILPPGTPALTNLEAGELELASSS